MCLTYYIDIESLIREVCYCGYIGSKSWKLYGEGLKSCDSQRIGMMNLGNDILFRCSLVWIVAYPWMKTWGLGICIASFRCLLLGFMWPTSSKGTLAWTREMKRLFVWWKHGFICIIKRDQEWSKHGKKIEGMRDQLCTMKKEEMKSET